MATFSKTRCMKRCDSLPNVFDRVRCCADCRALEAARMRQEREAVRRQTAHETTAAPRRSSQRFDVLFASGPRAKARVARRHRSALTRVLAGLGDAADDRRAATLAADTAKQVALAACNLGYPNANQRRDREACISAANAAHSAAVAIIEAATEEGEGVDVAAAIEEALEEQQRETNELLAAAEVDLQRAEIEAERRRREDAERQQQNTQTMFLVGGLVVAVAAVGGYVLLREDGPRGGKESA